MVFVCPEGRKMPKNQTAKTLRGGRPKIQIDKAELEYLVKEGFSDKEIAEYFNCAERTIRYNKSKYNITSNLGGEREYSGRPPVVLDEDDIELITKLIVKGLSNKEIGKIIGCSDETIRQFRNMYNIDAHLEEQVTSLYASLTFPTVFDISRETGFSIKYVRKVLSKKSLLVQAESYRRIETTCALERLHFIDSLVLSYERIDESFECKPFFSHGKNISRTGKKGRGGGIKNARTFQAFQAAKGQ